MEKYNKGGEHNFKFLYDHLKLWFEDEGQAGISLGAENFLSAFTLMLSPLYPHVFKVSICRNRANKKMWSLGRCCLLWKLVCFFSEIISCHCYNALVVHSTASSYSFFFVNIPRIPVKVSGKGCKYYYPCFTERKWRSKGKIISSWLCTESELNPGFRKQSLSTPRYFLQSHCFPVPLLKIHVV